MHFSAVEGVDDQIYAIGGSTGTVSSSEVDAYNPVINSWTTASSLPLDRQGLGAAILPNGHILAISGLNTESNTYETEVDSLNVASYSATATGSLTVTAAQANLTVIAPITVAAGQTPTNILVGVATGIPFEMASDRFSAQVSWGDGSTSNGSLEFSGPNLSVAYLYATKPSPYLVGGQYAITVSLAAGESVNVWDSGHPRPALPTLRSGLAVATSTTGLVYAAGGSDASNIPSAEVDVINPSTSTVWSTVAPLPLARTRLSLAPLPGGEMLAIGGLDPTGQTDAEVDLYNPTTNTWSVAAPLPDPRSAAATAVGPNGIVYVIGGKDLNRNPTAEVDAYNPSTNTWSVVASLPTARAAPAASVGPDGKIYVFGGIDSTGTYLSDTLVYTPASNSWTESTPMPVAANQRSAVLGADGLIHVLGGYTPSTGSLSEVDTFNTATGVWTTVNPLPTPRSLAGVAVTPAGTLLVIGGQDQSLSAGASLVPQIDFTATAAPLSVMGFSSAIVTSAVTNLTVLSPTAPSGQTLSGDMVATFTPNIAGATPGTYSAYLTWGDGTTSSASVIPDPIVSGQYDVLAGNNSPVLGVAGPVKFTVTVYLTSSPPIASPSWTASPAPLPVPLGGIRTSATVDSTGLVYVLGGNNPSVGGAQSTVEVLNPVSNTWSPGTPLPEARYRVAAVSSGTGLIYAIGGQDSSGNTYSEVDVFQPDKNRLTQAAPLPIPLSCAAAVLGPDGRIYVFGGQDSTGAPTADVEAYNPYTNTWAILTSLPTARSFLAGAVGSDGRIYAIGGQDASGNPSGEVDAYNFLTNTWTLVASLPTPRTGVTATEGVDGRIYAIGGALVGGASTTETDVYNPATNSWTTISNLPLDRQGLASVSLGNGLLLAIGGNSTTTGGDVSEVDMLAVTDPALTASGSVNVVANSAATTTTLTSSANPAVYGQLVTLTATVSLSTATGTVTFYNGATELGTSTLNGSGVAMFSLNSLGIGPVSLTATYDGDAKDSASTSAPLILMINEATTTTSVVASAVDPTSGQAVTFTATVAPVSPGLGSPTGSVSFFDGAELLGTIALSGGTAMFTTSALTIGGHTVTASYAGDGSYLPSVTGTILSAAGDGYGAGEYGGYTGDGGPSTEAELNEPLGLAVDSAGNLFIADWENFVVREVVKATGDIVTIAGNGHVGYSGDGGPATAAELGPSEAIAVDSSGNVFISDTFNNVVREVVKATGDIVTIAGNGVYGYSGEGGPATSAELAEPRGLAFDAQGNLYIADVDNNLVREVVKSTGDIITFAGNGGLGETGDGGAPTSAQIGQPSAVLVDPAGNVYISCNNVIREVVKSTGLITTVAGIGPAGYSGDGGSATSPVERPRGHRNGLLGRPVHLRTRQRRHPRGGQGHRLHHHRRRHTWRERTRRRRRPSDLRTVPRQLRPGRRFAGRPVHRRRE